MPETSTPADAGQSNPTQPVQPTIYRLETPEAVVQFLQDYPNSIIFKAGTCHKTMQGFGFLQEKLETRSDLPVGVIAVVEARAASNFVAEQTAIRHESPQVILFKEGTAVFEVNNWNITPEALTVGFAQVPANADAHHLQQGDTQTTSNQATSTRAASDVSHYLGLLSAYLEGTMSEEEFSLRYTTYFRDDATLRSKQEVEILGSIFGDVDRHIEMHRIMGGRVKEDAQTRDSVVRQRARAAYENLQALVSS